MQFQSALLCNFISALTFTQGTTTADVNDAIREMGQIVEYSDVQEFEPAYGKPVLYFP